MTVGPLAGALIELLERREVSRRPSVWAVGWLPLAAGELPAELLGEIEASGALLVAEEHVATGGAGEALARCLLERGVSVRRFGHAAARGYPSGRYGSQAWHRQESGLDAMSLLQRLAKLRSEIA